jgi:hypothetical protein
LKVVSEIIRWRLTVLMLDVLIPSPTSCLRESAALFSVRFEVFTAVIMKNAVLWDVAPCRSCVNRRFGGTYRLRIQGRKIREQGSRWLQTEPPVFYPEDGGDTFLRNVGSHKIYTAPHPIRWHSYSVLVVHMGASPLGGPLSREF